jgi:hypothetical protein
LNMSSTMDIPRPLRHPPEISVAEQRHPPASPTESRQDRNYGARQHGMLSAEGPRLRIRSGCAVFPNAQVGVNGPIGKTKSIALAAADHRLDRVAEEAARGRPVPEFAGRFRVLPGDLNRVFQKLRDRTCHVSKNVLMAAVFRRSSPRFRPKVIGARLEAEICRYPAPRRLLPSGNSSSHAPLNEMASILTRPLLSPLSSRRCRSSYSVYSITPISSSAGDRRSRRQARPSIS